MWSLQEACTPVDKVVEAPKVTAVSTAAGGEGGRTDGVAKRVKNQDKGMGKQNELSHRVCVLRSSGGVDGHLEHCRCLSQEPPESRPTYCNMKRNVTNASKHDIYGI